MKRRTMRTGRPGVDLSSVIGASMVIAITLSAFLTCAGCGGSADPRGKRVGVHGEVKLDGKSLETASILFHSGEGEGEVVAIGYVEDGIYEIAPKDGPLVGKARVEFQATPIDPEEFEFAMEEAATKRERFNGAVVAIPPQYGANSKLTADVTEDGDNKFDFDLKSGR